MCFKPFKDFDLYYDSLEECLEKLMPTTTKTATTSTATTSTASPSTITSSSQSPSSFHSPSSSQSPSSSHSPSPNQSPSPSQSPSPITTQPTNVTTSDNNEDQMNESSLMLLLISLPSFILGAVASGLFIFMYLKRRIMKTKCFICKIKRRKNSRKKAAPKETIEMQPKIKEVIIKEEIEEVTAEDNDDTPKRSNIKRILDSWKSVSPQKKPEVKTPKVTRFSIFDDFKDSKDSKTSDESPICSRIDSIESRKSLYFLKLLF